MYKCKHFDIKELVDIYTYEDMKEKSWWLFDERALKTLDRLREKFGVAIVNNWSFGGDYQFRGFRPQDYFLCVPYSQHRYGRAFDVTFKHKTAHFVRQYILEHKEEFPYITCLEMDVNWLHFDVRNVEPIMVIKP